MFTVQLELFFTLLSAISFELPVTRTPDNSNLFSISLEGSSYRESAVQTKAKTLNHIENNCKL